MFMNDLVSFLGLKLDGGIYISPEMDKLFVLMYADDVSGLADTAVRLQRLINTIDEFCNKVKMEINLDKSKIMVFRNGGPLRQYENWTYKGERVEVVPFYKYLGAYFTPKLSWTMTKDTLANQANKALASIYKCQKQFGYFNPKQAFKIFDAMIVPILCYSAEIWGYQYSECIERVQVKYCKRLCGLNRTVSNFFALSECGRLPLSVIYTFKCISYWVRLLQMAPNRYPRQMYLVLRNQDSSGRTNWASHVKRLLYENGFGYVWLANEIGDAKTFLLSFKTRIKDCALQKLQAQVNDSPKSLYYSQFKTMLNVERYLYLELPYLFKKTLSNFRCSGHKLMVEKGRHLNINREYRYCNYCLSMRQVYVVEDEYHMFMLCPLYNALRRELFATQWLSQIETVYLFTMIMSDENDNHIYAVAHYLVKCEKLREDFMRSQA